MVFALINLCIVAVFFCVLVCRRIGKRRVPLVAKKNINKFMFALTVFSSLILLLLWISYAFDITIINAFLAFSPMNEISALKWIAVFLMGLSTVIAIAAGMALGDAFRIHTPEAGADVNRVRRGVYGVVRNPIVLGVFGYALSVMLLNPGLVSLVMVLTVIVSYDYKVNVEAREMQDRFGDAWRDYCSTTGKYIPIITRRTGK